MCRSFKSISKTKYLTPYFYIGPGIIILAILMVYPICRVIQFSFYDNYFVKTNPYWVGLKNFKELLQNELFWVTFKNTAIFTTVSVIFHLIVGLIFAVLLNQPLGRKTLAIFRSILILPWIFTAAIVAINWRLLLDPFGIINFTFKKLGMINSWIDWFGNTDLAMPTLIFVNIWRGYPFVMISLLAALQGIPSEISESAKVDGANAWQIFYNITLPLLRPVILTVGLLDTIWTFRLFPLIWLTTGGGPEHVTEVLATYTYKLGFVSFEFSKASALAVIILIFITGFTFFYLRQMRSTLY